MLLAPARPTARPRAGASVAPVVVYGATTRLTSTERLSFERVQSRMFFKVIAGSGIVEVNGEPLAVRPHSIVGMPWGHRVAYHPDEGAPFVIVSAHLVPRHRLDREIELFVPHQPGEHLSGADWRSDARLGVPDAPFLTDVAGRPGLGILLEYIGHVWSSHAATPAMALHLGGLLMYELNREAVEPEPFEDTTLPPRLRRVMAWARGHLYLSISIEDMCSAADVSASTLGRMFRDHLGAAPLSWVHELKLARAESLLVESMVSIRQVARQLGFGDPHYFTRWFRKHRGCSPSEWRRRHGRV